MEEEEEAEEEEEEADEVGEAEEVRVDDDGRFMTKVPVKVKLGGG